MCQTGELTTPIHHPLSMRTHTHTRAHTHKHTHTHTHTHTHAHTRTHTLTHTRTRTHTHTHTHTQVIPFCGIAPDLEDSTDSTDAPAGAGSAVVVKTKIWSGRQALKVFFMSEVPAGWTFDGQPLTTDVIIDWANIWSENGKYDKVPIFKETSIRNKGDIRVDFSSMHTHNLVYAP